MLKTHDDAIKAYKEFLAAHPDATLEQKFKKFNVYVDTVELANQLAEERSK